MEEKEKQEFIGEHIKQYQEEHPDWKFVKHTGNDGEDRWRVTINQGEIEESRFLEVMSDEEADRILKDHNVDAHDAIYFKVPNLGKSGKKRFGSFIDRPGDALISIRNGFGDGFRSSSLFGSTSHSPIYFLNREIGDKLRAIFLREFEDTKIKYVVALETTAGWGHTYFVTENDGWFSPVWNINDDKPKTFDTEEEAQALADKYEAEVQNLIASIPDKEAAEKFYIEETRKGCEYVSIAAAKEELVLKFFKKDDDTRSVAHRFEIHQILEMKEVA